MRALYSQYYRRIVLANDKAIFECSEALIGASSDPEISDLAINENGRLSWTPGPGDLGEYWLWIYADDGHQGRAEFKFSLRVLDPDNQPPVIHNKTTATLGELYTYDLRASDPDGDALNYRFQAWQSAAGMSISEQGALQWMPTRDHGEIFVLVSVDDGKLEQDAYRYPLTVVDPHNQDPVMNNPSPPLEVQVGQTYVYDTHTTDADGDPIAYQAYTWPHKETLQISETGVVTWTPAAADVGVVKLSVIASDDFGGDANIVYEFSVTPALDNSPPTAVNAAITTPEDVAVSFVLQAGDADNDPLTFVLDSQPAHGVLSGAAPNLTYTPNENFFGEDSFTYHVNDGASDSESVTVSITVNAINDAPLITSVPVTTVTEDQTYLYDVEARDADGQTLAFALASAPPGMTIHPQTGEITWPTDADDVGDHPIAIAVHDTQASATQSFTLTVDPRALDAAAPADQVNRVGDAVSLPIRADNTERSHCAIGLPHDLALTLPQTLIRGLLTDRSLGDYRVTLGAVDTTTPVISEFNVRPRPGSNRMALTLDPGTYFVQPNGGAWNASSGARVAGCDANGGNCTSGWWFNYGITTAGAQQDIVTSKWATVELASQHAPNRCFRIHTRQAVEFNILLSNYNPTNGQIGLRVLQVADSADFTWRVVDASGAQPAITTTPATLIDEHLTFTYDLEATHPNAGEALRYLTTGYAHNTSIDAQSGAFAWQPADNIPVYTTTVDPQCYAPTANATPYLNAANWQYYRDDGSHNGQQDWLVRQGGLTIVTEGNGDPSVYASDLDISDAAIEFNLRVEGNDDDIIGFAWGLQDMAHMYRLEWQRSAGPNSAYLRVREINTPQPRYGGEHATDIIHYQNADPGVRWDYNVNYTAYLDLTPGNATIFLYNADADRLLDIIQIHDDTYPRGRIGYFAHSQDGVHYRARLADRVPHPDLIVTAIDFDDGFAATDHIGVTVINRGAAPSLTATSLVLQAGHLDGDQAFVAGLTLRRQTIPALAPGEAITLDFFPSELDPALTLLQARIDPDRVTVPECNEGNNTARLPLMNVRVEDSHRAFSEQRFGVRVVDVNEAPTLTSVAPAYALVGEPYAYTAMAADPDIGDNLVNEIIAGPFDAHFLLGGNQYLWIPRDEEVGQSVTTTIRFTDLQGAYAQQTFNVQVHRRPHITSQPAYVATRGVLYQYPVAASDADGDALTYRLLASPEGMSIDENSGLIRWTPSVSGDAHRVTIQVDDNRSGTAEQSYLLGVLEPSETNIAPSLDANTPPLTTHQMQHYYFDFDVDDPDGAAAVFRLLEGPDAMAIDRDTGEVWWHVPFTQTQNHPVTVQVYDRRGGFATYRYVIRVNDIANGMPAIISTPVREMVPGSRYHYQVLAQDPDNDPLTYRLTAAPHGMQIDSAGNIRWHPALDVTGTKRVTVQVSDSVNHHTEQSYTLSDSGN